MLILNWFKSMIQKLIQKPVRIIILGLDNSGKTSLFMRLQNDPILDMDFSQRPYSKIIQIGESQFQALELGNYSVSRRTWKNQVNNVDGIIFLIDSLDAKRFEQNKIEFQELLQMIEQKDVPLAIFGNKIDRPGAVLEKQLREALNIQNARKGRPMQIFMCSVLHRIGYKEGFQWLLKILQS